MIIVNMKAALNMIVVILKNFLEKGGFANDLDEYNTSDVNKRIIIVTASQRRISTIDRKNDISCSQQ